MKQRVPACAPGPATLLFAFDQDFIGLAELGSVNLGLQPLLELFQRLVTPVLLSGRDVVLPGRRLAESAKYKRVEMTNDEARMTKRKPMSVEP